ncbi:MAG: RNA methyltransferase [Deltaproteobacteria bacterium]|nr:RNA methyltransferase [Deltaproteobacteria bacterium]
MYIDNFYIALLHYPVYNRKGDVVTTAVANVDIHDISRAAKTFGARHFYIVTPVLEQHRLVEKILEHWLRGFGADFNPSRKAAFQIIRLKKNLEEVQDDIASLSGARPKVIATGANLPQDERLRSPGSLKREILDSAGSFLFLFGTGWGLADEVIGMADYLLTPIRGPFEYNHLSVRSAVSIILDRLWRENFE